MTTTAPTGNDGYLSILLKVLVWLNILDTVLTVLVVSLKWATEANPLMEVLLQKGPLVFGTVKMSMAVAGVVLLWKARKSRWVFPVSCFLVLCYAAIVIYEIIMIVAMSTGGL